MLRIACFGGLYSNYLALQVAIQDALRRGVEAIYCLGDCGAFGPHPDRTVELLRAHDVRCLQGNYDHSIGHGLGDCQCGYTDPRDNYFAQISYDYTFENTSPEHRNWLRDLPAERRLEVAGKSMLMCHGSPRRMNEFLWESTTSTQFLERLADEERADFIFVTHTGIKWRRPLARGGEFVNVGVLGRPENDGRPNVWYTLLEADNSGNLAIEFIRVDYDHTRLAQEMEAERLPGEFIQTIRTGWWTTCLEILPSKERRRGPY